MKECTEVEIYEFLSIYDCYGRDAKEYIDQFLHDFFLDQPDRLNPEDHIAEKGKVVCDSQT